MNSFFEKLVNLIFPKECLGCTKPGIYICGNCLNSIELNKKIDCVLCRKNTDFSKICPECKKKTALKAVFVVANYNNQLLEAIIHNLKYQYIEELADVLVKLIVKYDNQNLLFEKFILNSSNTIICSVALHKKRYMSRGFNQSELIGQRLSDKLDIPYYNLLFRNKNTPSQVNLKRKDRQLNVKDAFIYNSDAKSYFDKKVIIIDDVLTTGSTLNECANTLKQQGYEEIYGLVLAQRED